MTVVDREGFRIESRRKTAGGFASDTTADRTTRHDELNDGKTRCVGHGLITA